MVSVARGTGTAIPARAAMSKAWSIAIRLADYRRGVELDRTLCWPAGNPALSELRLRQARSAQEHPLQRTPRQGDVRSRDAPVVLCDRPGRHLSGAALRLVRRPDLGADLA